MIAICAVAHNRAINCINIFFRGVEYMESQHLYLAIVVIIIIAIFLYAQRRTGGESLVSPYNLSETNADLVELSMRRQLFK